LLQVQPNPPSFDPLKLLAGLLGAKGMPVKKGKDGKAHPQEMLLPLLLPPGLLVPPGTKGALPPGGDEVEEQLRMMPDGSRCKTVLVWRHGHLKSNKTKCMPSDHSEERRLQGLLLAAPVDDMEDVWVLGGAFLDKHITVLDFDNRRIGIARAKKARKYLAQAASSSPAATIAHPKQAASQVLHQAVVTDMDRADASEPGQEADESGGGFPWGSAFFGVCLISMVAGGSSVYRKMRRPKNVTDIPDPEEVEKQPTVDHQAADEDPDADADAAE